MFEPGPPRDERTLPRHFRFTSCEIDRSAMRVLRDGVELKLEPKAFDLLLLLAANPGRVVEKEEIFERLWEMEFVSDNALTRVVAALRHELGDRAKRPTIIQTVWKRGYRFLPTIEDVESGSSQPAPGGSSGAAARQSRLRLFAILATILTAVVLGFAWVHRGAVQSPVPQRVLSPVQLTSAPGIFLDPDFAPDGNQLVFASDMAGGLELFVQPLRGGAPRQLTHCGVCAEPAWSPDGQWIAYTDRAHGGLWLVSAATGETRQLTAFGTQPAWSPDSRSVVFSNPGSPTTGPNGWVAIPGSTLWIVQVATGRTRHLTEPIPNAGGQGSPTFSPDGRSVIFATNNFIRTNIWRVPRDGGTPEPLLPAGEGGGIKHIFKSPVPDPRGGGIFLIRQGIGSPWIERLTTGRERRLQPLLAPAPPGTAGLAVSRDGRHLAFAVQESTTSIEEVEVRSDGSVIGAPKTLNSPPVERVLTPLYSPDGKYLVFLRWRTGAPVDAVILDRQGRELRTISDHPIGVPEWVSATDVVLRPGPATVRVNVATGRVVPFAPIAGSNKILAPALTHQFTWNTGLTRLAFTADAGGSVELFGWNVGEPEARQLTHLDGRVTFPEFSPDGQRIVFEFYRHSSRANKLWTISAIGGESQRILTRMGTSWPGLDPIHGDLVVYAADRDGVWHLAVAGTASPERLLAVPPETAGFLRWPTWSPGGGRIAYEREHYRSRLWLVDLYPDAEQSSANSNEE